MLEELEQMMGDSPAMRFIKAAEKGEYSKLTDTDVQWFIRKVLAPLKPQIIKQLLDAPENVNMLEGRTAELKEGDLDKYISGGKESQLDIMGHAMSRSSGGGEGYYPWGKARSAAQSLYEENADKFRNRMKHFLRASKDGDESGTWTFDALDVGILKRDGSVFTLLSYEKGAISAVAWLKSFFRSQATNNGARSVTVEG